MEYINHLMILFNRVDSKDVNKLQLEGLTKAGVFDEFEKIEIKFLILYQKLYSK